MRLDMRFYGITESGRHCFMDGTIYADDEDSLHRQMDEAVKHGPWYYDGTSELALEKITCTNVRKIVDGKVQNPIR